MKHVSSGTYGAARRRFLTAPADASTIWCTTSRIASTIDSPHVLSGVEALTSLRPRFRGADGPDVASARAREAHKATATRAPFVVGGCPEFRTFGRPSTVHPTALFERARSVDRAGHSANPAAHPTDLMTTKRWLASSYCMSYTV